MTPAPAGPVQIGDHKQLRPKVDSWPLTVQFGQGHNLNVSLFERLVTSGFPHVSLGVQVGSVNLKLL